MYLKLVLMIVSAFGFGLLSSGGVFTVFVSVGLVPRFADKTNTAPYIIKYENGIVAGAILGCLFSIYAKGLTPVFSKFGQLPLVGTLVPFLEKITWGSLLLTIFGIFAGMFVGCFAIAIAEMLNSIPVFERRTGLGKGTGIVLLSFAVGKMLGSFIYYAVIIQK